MKKTLLSFISLSFLAATYAYEVNSTDANTLKRFYDLQPNSIQAKLKSNASTAWKAIDRFPLGQIRSISLFSPAKGFIIDDSLGLNQDITGVTTLNLSEYGISSLIGSPELKIQNNFQFFNIWTIDFSNTNIRNIDGISAADSLITLKLNNNQITTLPSSLKLIQSTLRHLELRNNKLSGGFVRFNRRGNGVIFKLSRLTHLDISNNNLGGYVYDDFKFFKNATYIDISCNGFKGSLFSGNAQDAAYIANKFKNLGTTFIATAKTCLPGKTKNSFSNQSSMSNYGIEFGQKVHSPVAGTSDIEPKCNTVSNKKLYYNKPTTFLCSAGTVSQVTDTTGGWKWQCNGSGSYANKPASCSANKVQPAQCASSSNYGLDLAEIKSSNLAKFCDTANSVSKSSVSLSPDFSSWTWSCIGNKSVDFPNGKKTSCETKANESQQCTMGRARPNLVFSSIDVASLDNQKKNKIFCEVGSAQNFNVSSNTLTWDCKGTSQSIDSGLAQIDLCNHDVTKKQFTDDDTKPAIASLCSTQTLSVLDELSLSYSLSRTHEDLSYTDPAGGNARIYRWTCSADSNSTTTAEPSLSNSCRTRHWFIHDSFEHH